MSSKYLFITGGVVSSIGKGLTASALGMLLKNRGYNVTIQKMDPYLCDPARLSISEHGEVFVLDDGTPCDLDLGHYERFIDENLPGSAETTGQMIYKSVIEKEERGEYRGKTVQIIPHVTNEIKERIYSAARSTKADIVITEIGGTVGDIESLPHLEAIRQIKKEVGANNVLYVHLTLIPYLSSSGELKTKPIQHSVNELRGIGIQPDILICRTQQAITPSMKEKIALFCDVDKSAIIENRTAESVYKVPIALHEQELDTVVLNKLGLSLHSINLEPWNNMLYSMHNPRKVINIALIGKYANCPDAYLSVIEAIKHASIDSNIQANISLVNCGEMTDEFMGEFDGIVVAGPNDDLVPYDMLKTMTDIRESLIPFLGVGFGFTAAVSEFARNVCGIKTDIVLRDRDTVSGATDISITKEDSFVAEAYGTDVFSERNYCSCELDFRYIDSLNMSGLVTTGSNVRYMNPEIMEYEDNPFFVIAQPHLEFKSRPNKPSPLFSSFIRSIDNYSESRI